MPATPISPQNHSIEISAPFQLNSKPNSSPQSMLQSFESKKASHPGRGIMLWGPAMDTLEARAECWANKLTLTRGRGCTAQDKLCTFLHVPIGRFLSKQPTKLMQIPLAILTGTANVQQYSVYTCILAVDLHSPTLC